MHQHGGQLGDKDDGADKGGRDAGQEYGPRGNVQAVAEPRPGRVVQSVVNRFHGTVEQLRSDHQPDATQQQTPFEGLTPKDDGRSQDQGGEKEMHEKAGMAPDTELDSPQRFAELIAPQTPL